MCIEAARDALQALGPAHSEKSYEVSARVPTHVPPVQAVIGHKLHDARVPD